MDISTIESYYKIKSRSYFNYKHHRNNEISKLIQYYNIPSETGFFAYRNSLLKITQKIG